MSVGTGPQAHAWQGWMGYIVAMECKSSGGLDWIDELAAVPREFGVSNIYADIGLSFGALAITHPRLAAAMVCKLVKGLGADHVLWGTDSVWFGSPQWQIETFRRIELPEDLQVKLDLAPLGPANSPIKNAIFAINAAGQYGLELDEQGQPVADYAGDELSRLKSEYLSRAINATICSGVGFSAIKSRAEMDAQIQVLAPTFSAWR